MNKTKLLDMAGRLKATGGNPSAVESIAAEMFAAVSALPDDLPHVPVEPKPAKAKAAKPRVIKKGRKTR